MQGERDEDARGRFVRALDGGGSVAAAARAAGVGRTVPYTWAKRGDAKVSEAIERAQGRGGQGRARPAAEVEHGQELRELARDVLRGVLEDEKTSARDKIAAARAVAALAPPPRPQAPAGSSPQPDDERLALGDEEARAMARSNARGFLRAVP